MCKRNSQQLGKIKPNYQISTAEHTFDVNLSSSFHDGAIGNHNTLEKRLKNTM
jgi:hypothetical protein